MVAFLGLAWYQDIGSIDAGQRVESRADPGQRCGDLIIWCVLHSWLFLPLEVILPRARREHGPGLDIPLLLQPLQVVNLYIRYQVVVEHQESEALGSRTKESDI